MMSSVPAPVPAPSDPSKSIRKRRRIIVVVASLLLLLVAGCRHISYYGQAARGQMQIFWRQKSIEKLLADSATPADIKRRLRVIGEARAFAEQELSLKAKGHYTRYADLERPYVVWNVYAAPRHSIEPKSWWYPIVGSQSYRGYFDVAGATNCAIELKEEGLDVYVGGVEAYSTLGWFRDPVLNTWIDRDDSRLAALVFHELTHQRLYIPGDTPFNEAFATAVERAGVRRWLEQKGDPSKRAAWDAMQQRRDDFAGLVRQTQASLKDAYSASDESAKVSGKAQVLGEFQQQLAALQTQWGNTNAYRSWQIHKVNNARLNTVSTYYDLVPSFLGLLKRHDHDFESFYQAVKELGNKPKKERRKLLAFHAQEAPASD
jgi:predicted aminopeptidase